MKSVCRHFHNPDLVMINAEMFLLLILKKAQHFGLIKLKKLI